MVKISCLTLILGERISAPERNFGPFAGLLQAARAFSLTDQYGSIS